MSKSLEERMGALEKEVNELKEAVLQLKNKDSKDIDTEDIDRELRRSISSLR